MVLQIITSPGSSDCGAKGGILGERQNGVPLCGEKRKRKLELDRKEVAEGEVGGSNGKGTHAEPVEGLYRYKDIPGGGLWLWKVLSIKLFSAYCPLHPTVSSTPPAIDTIYF